MKWEYKAILISDSVQGLPNRLLLSLTLNKLLNELSDWELVAVDNGIAYFKRQIPIDNTDFGRYIPEGGVSARDIPKDTTIGIKNEG